LAFHLPFIGQLATGEELTDGQELVEWWAEQGSNLWPRPWGVFVLALAQVGQFWVGRRPSRAWLRA